MESHELHFLKERGSFLNLSDTVVHGAAQLEASDGVLRECVEFTTSALFHLKFSQSLYQSVSQSVCHSVSLSLGQSVIRRDDEEVVLAAAGVLGETRRSGG